MHHLERELILNWKQVQQYWKLHFVRQISVHHPSNPPPTPLTQFGLLHIFLRHVSTKPHAEEGGYGASRGIFVLQLEVEAKRGSESHRGGWRRIFQQAESRKQPQKESQSMQQPFESDSDFHRCSVLNVSHILRHAIFPFQMLSHTSPSPLQLQLNKTQGDQ